MGEKGLMRRSLRCLPVALTIAAWTAILSAAPQQAPPSQPATPRDESIPTIRIVGAARPKIPIALPSFQAAGAADPKMQEVARTLHDVVRDDLDFSGYFQIVPEEYLKLVKDPGGAHPNFKEWLGAGAHQDRLRVAGREGEGDLRDGL